MDESASLRRKAVNKRRVNVLVSEDEDEQNHTLSTPPQKKARYIKNQVESGSDVFIDVDGNDNRSEGLSTPSRSATPPPSRKSLPKKRGTNSSSSKAQGSKKRRPVDHSEDDFVEDVVSDDLGPGLPDEYDNDQEFVDDGPRKGKSKAVTKGRGGKGTKNSKAKGKAESQEKEIIVRDERQGVASSSMKIRIKPIINVDSASATKSGSDSVLPDPDKGDGPSSQKKRKLPPIKKNKTAASGISTTAAKPSVSAKSTVADGALATSAIRASASSQGGDFNLQDRNVYEMLFKTTGGSNSRAGNLRENEERRKYLNSLRQADKAKRALDAKRTFDLQAQMDKISAFEDRLRRVNSCVLYPNILGAKMRETFEQGRRRREPKEEGEMSWFVYWQSPRCIADRVIKNLLKTVYSICIVSLVPTVCRPSPLSPFQTVVR
ncbi:hypothetical protein J3R30DRAFT_3695605 [Lentinula aciculospora]|uniref:Uncharacterized protein n=1 Tax=Lentinula aciculospora TaxID=153920 RepID=A0A9W9DW25_9AGAR|nr:hypothetical protein J3R30DRAFT_3695605 [Lentinula aciculospora]